MVVNFIIEKTENMEQADKSNWPGSAVRFAQFLYTRLQDVTEVAIDQNTCMAQDSANKVRLSIITLRTGRGQAEICSVSIH